MDCSIYEEQNLVGCDAVLMGKKFLTYCVLVFLGYKQPKTGVLDPKDKRCYDPSKSWALLTH
jgi:hypothetical protein